jgi:1,4-alpha-glucan branching enzyme
MAGKQLATHKEKFWFRAGDAMSVLLAGDFTHWQANPLPMRKGPDGVWEASVALTPGSHSYKFIVDGAWRDDPECKLHVPNPFGSEDMVRRVA